MHPKVPGDWHHLDEPAQIPRYQRIASMVNGHMTILDVGCAMGTLRTYLPPQATYHGIDPSFEACEIARSRGMDVECANPDKTVPKGPWDCIVMTETLYYSEDPCGQLERYARELKPDGLLIVSIWQNPKKPTWKRRLACLLNPKRPLGNLHCSKMVEHWLRYNGVILSHSIVERPSGPPWKFWSWTR